MSKRNKRNLMPHEMPHELSDHSDLLLEGLPRLAEKDAGPIDMTPAALTASLKSNIDLMMKYTTTANDTRLKPMVYVWKSGYGMVMLLETSPDTPSTSTPESLGLVASGMGKGSEGPHMADAVALIYDARVGDESGPITDAWVVLLRIREGDRLWSCAQTYSYAPKGDAVIWGDRIIWDSAVDPDPAPRKRFQLPAWYPTTESGQLNASVENASE